MNDKKPLVEAALFISSEPLELEDLADITGAEEKDVRESLEGIRNAFQEEDHGIELFKSPKGYELRVKPDYIDRVSHLTPYSDLSRGPLKVLALVAFRGPIKQSSIVKIIGNRAYSYINELEERELIRSEKHKRTKKLEITKEFKDYFGIEGREELRENLEEALGEGEIQNLMD